MTRTRFASAGFTLVELLVVLTILGIVAAVAVPALTRDSAESDFRRYVYKLAQSMRRARYEALSSREDRVVFIAAPAAGSPSSYQLEAAIPNETTRSPISQREVASARVKIVGVLNLAASPTTTYNPFASALPAEIRFTGLNTVQVRAGTGAGTVLPEDRSATVFLQTADGRHKARIVAFHTTAHTRAYFSW